MASTPSFLQPVHDYLDARERAAYAAGLKKGQEAERAKGRAIAAILRKLVGAAKQPVDDAYKGKVDGEEYAYDHIPYYYLGCCITEGEETLRQLDGGKP